MGTGDKTSAPKPTNTVEAFPVAKKAAEADQSESTALLREMVDQRKQTVNILATVVGHGGGTEPQGMDESETSAHYSDRNCCGDQEFGCNPPGTPPVYPQLWHQRTRATTDSDATLWQMKPAYPIPVCCPLWVGSDLGAQIADVIIGYVFSGVKHQFWQYLVPASLHVIGGNMGLGTEPDSRLQHRHLVTEPFEERMHGFTSKHTPSMCSVLSLGPRCSFAE